MQRNVLLLVQALALCFLADFDACAAPADAFVRVSPRDPRYLELSDGRPYIPIGLNLIHPNTRDADGMARMEEWMQKLSTNGGNYIRVWVSSPFWDVEHQKSGEYDESKARRIDEMLKMARRHGLRVKLTLEHFREMSDTPRQRWANKPLHLVTNGGTATNVADFFDGETSRAQFKKKLAWLAKRYGDDPTVYAWELWNEVNAVATGAEHYMPWTEVMLSELHRLFPKNLAMQSLGSFDTARARELYHRHSLLPGNDVAQVHRYLDLGAPLEVCHGPVDVLAAEATRELSGYGVKKPVILAESGAVEPRHSGPFKLYAKDQEGILLHDVLFAPFFSGAAGAGQIWHWDVYVDRNNLWPHFARFAEAVKGIDPPAENFTATSLPHPRLRVYALKGRKTVLLWCRDGQSDWKSELEQGHPAETLDGVKLDLTGLGVKPSVRLARIYDPWRNRWSEAPVEGGVVALPPFSRSVVVAE
ncbi:MAG: cellulase family glycosylhydrolase [Verrucomicrobia bacterium]|nr:cellulase family glycosylhydrolase [Verrucomicrobiota bacterium]